MAASLEPLTCSLSAWISCSPVKVCRLTVLANGWTVNASAKVTTLLLLAPLAA
ncbi:hypothetical protein SALBM217S_06410 [Streptomyces griseoloalbus]